MKKKVLAVILAVVSVAALAACGSNGTAEPESRWKCSNREQVAVQAQDTTIKIGAKSL